MLSYLVQARCSVGLSQRALAERLGVDIQRIARLERGVGSIALLVAAMTALNLRLNGIGPGATLPTQLSASRVRRGISISDVARRAGLTRRTVAAVEAGNGSVASLLKLMAVIAPRARPRAPERAYWGAGDKQDRDSRFTPADFMANIYAAFGDVDLDPCANAASPVVAGRYILLDNGGDGLVDDWSGRLAFVNPPFSALMKWLNRAHDQWRAGNVETVVCLSPVRTDSGFFHDTLSDDADMYLLRGRVRFLDSRGGGQHTPFSLMLLTLGATEEQRLRYASLVPGRWMTAVAPSRPAGLTQPSDAAALG